MRGRPANDHHGKENHAHAFDDAGNGNSTSDLQDDGVHFSVSFSAF
ncbi:MAG: hypothetical protein OEY45_11540 [Gammaproteobacteria bacterium]|nr:hypothetical protein [Gammaproteobacteria bacterium]